VPAIEISQDLFRRIQRNAVPLVDTVETVIARACDALEKSGSAVPSSESEAGRLFNGKDAPDLSHSTLVSATIDGVNLKNPYWNTLLDEMIRKGLKKYGKLSELRMRCPGNYVDGEKTDMGYHYLPDVGISIQGRDANSVWRATRQLCQDLGSSVTVHFRWAHKDKLKYPGELGRMSIS